MGDQFGGRGEILVDAPASLDVGYLSSFLERNDHHVLVCHGPEGHRCPLLTGECDKFESAHGVIFVLDLDDAQHRAIVAKYRRLDPDIPIRVVATPEQVDRYRHVLTDVELWTRVPSVAELDGFAAEVEASDRDRE